MLYFSFNDFADYAQDKTIEEIEKVEEQNYIYEIKEGKNNNYNNKKEEKIINFLKEKKELKNFLKDFFNIYEIENIKYYNTDAMDKTNDSNIICKIEDKEIFIYIKIISNIDNNISYKMFSDSLKIMIKWCKNEKQENKRYPIVIPIVIYIGMDIWNNNINKKYDKINYISYEDNRINFSYNMININELKIRELEKINSKIAEELINFKR